MVVFVFLHDIFMRSEFRFFEMFKLSFFNQNHSRLRNLQGGLFHRDSEAFSGQHIQ